VLSAITGDSLNKGDKLYDSVRGLLDSDEFKAHVTPELKAAVASLQTALTGAVARVDTTLEAAGKELAEVSRTVALRAQQGVILLYEDVEMTVLRVQLTVGEYQRLLSGLAFRKAGQVAQGVQEFVDAAGRQVRSLVLAGLLSIDDPRVRDTVIDVLLWSFDTAEDLQRQINDALQDVRNAGNGLSGQVSGAVDDIARAGGVLVDAVSGWCFGTDQCAWRSLAAGQVTPSQRCSGCGLQVGQFSRVSPSKAGQFWMRVNRFAC